MNQAYHCHRHAALMEESIRQIIGPNTDTDVKDKAAGGLKTRRPVALAYINQSVKMLYRTDESSVAAGLRQKGSCRMRDADPIGDSVLKDP